MVSSSVGADDAGSVEAEYDVEFLECDIVYYLVEGALCERGVDVAERSISAYG